MSTDSRQPQPRHASECPNVVCTLLTRELRIESEMFGGIKLSSCEIPSCGAVRLIYTSWRQPNTSGTPAGKIWGVLLTDAQAEIAEQNDNTITGARNTCHLIHLDRRCPQTPLRAIVREAAIFYLSSTLRCSGMHHRMHHWFAAAPRWERPTAPTKQHSSIQQSVSFSILD